MRVLAAIAMLLLWIVPAAAQTISSDRWSVMTSPDGARAAAISNGMADLSVYNDCQAVAIHYSIPVEDFDPVFAGRSEVDLTFVRDGGNLGYAQDVGFIENQGKMVFIVFVEPDSGFIRQLTSANRSITVGISRDAAAGTTPKNQTRFSAAGSTAAVNQAVAPCDQSSQDDAAAPTTALADKAAADSSGDGWTYELAMGELPQLNVRKGRSTLSLSCKRDRSGKYQLGYDFPADEMAPQLFGSASVYLQLSSIGADAVVLDAGAPEAFDGQVYFSHDFEPAADPSPLLDKSSGAISVSVSATAAGAPFNAMVFTARGLSDLLPDFRSQCAALAG